MAYTVINKPASYFNTVLYTGTQTQQTINVGFQPDFVWIKSRSNVQVHALFDAVRGVSIGALQSNSDAAENANQKLVAYTSTGFTLPSVNYEWTNTSGWTFASWNWLGANTTVSNTSGTISSTVSANPTSGFSVVTYTGTGSAATVGHGLGVAPSMILLKIRSAVDAWIVYSKSLGNTKIMVLNSTAAVNTRADWNNTSPTSSVFSIGTFSNENTNAATYVAYCFAEVKGYSKFGSYIGNGSTDGTFVYTGFKPAFVIVKNTTTAGNVWGLFDNKRIAYNANNYPLIPSASDAEDTTAGYIDLLSNGFKMRSTNDFNNKSGDTFIYMAFAENPFVSSTQIPTTAR
jgi:hypothetical protein